MNQSNEQCYVDLQRKDIQKVEFLSDQFLVHLYTIVKGDFIIIIK